MNKEKLQKVLENHRLWLVSDGIEGERADLSNTDLSNTNLRGANLSGVYINGVCHNGVDLSGACLSGTCLIDASLSGANLSGANLSFANLNGASLRHTNLNGANLYGADLSYAKLKRANLSGANLSGANLSYANLNGANLSGAYLRYANLNGVKYNENTSFFELQCPEEGSFIAWKKCRNDILVKLLIPEDALRSSATSRKCRASKAIVLEVIGAEKAISTNDMFFVYEVGKEVIPDSFDEDRWNDCSHGIHFFITRKEAENY